MSIGVPSWLGWRRTRRIEPPIMARATGRLSAAAKRLGSALDRPRRDHRPTTSPPNAAISLTRLELT